MAFDQTSVSFPGLELLSADFAVSRGVTPSICSCLCLPFDGGNLSPGTLAFRFGDSSWQFEDCVLASAHMHERVQIRGQSVWLWRVHLLDRRWRWQYGSISGRYNTRAPHAAASTQRTAQQLMALCLEAMGEFGFDVSAAPSNVYPPVHWESANPALALAQLCDYVACDVALGLDNRARIVALGVGDSAPLNAGEAHGKFRYVPRVSPSTIEVHCGESLFQHRLKLRAIARQGNLQEKKIAEADYFPSGALGTESFHGFPGVSSTASGSSAVNSALAFATAWRQFQVMGQENGSLAVPGCSEAIASTAQYVLKDHIIPNVRDLNGNNQLFPWYVEGEFWPYGDVGGNATQVYVGQATLLKERQIVEFPYPVVKIGNSGAIEEPELYLQVAYGVRTQAGNPVRLVRTASIGGGGGTLIVSRPELFATYSASGNTEAQATEEADAYLGLFQRKHANPQACEVNYGGLFPFAVDGRIAQVRWQVSQNGQTGITTLCEGEELVRSAVSARERRRREQLRQLVEAR